MKTQDTPTLPLTFSAEIRQATRVIHTRAEATKFIRGFLRGTASLSSYTKLLAALHPVYEAMECATERLAEVDPMIARFHFPQLHRLESLERDLQFLAGKNWRETVEVMEEAEFYAARSRRVSREEPSRLIAHLYTRYLGDLSGGQILSRIAGRSLGLEIGAGLDFYHFPEVRDVPAMKTLYRARLDELGSQERALRDAVIAEAIHAFKCNIAIFERLEGNAFRSLLRSLPLPWVRAPRRAAPVLSQAPAL